MAHCAQIPSFILHQVTCHFATGDTLFGPLNLSLDSSLCGLVGRNGVGKPGFYACWRAMTHRLAATSSAWFPEATLLSCGIGLQR